MKTFFDKWGWAIVAVALWAALCFCGVFAGEAQILDGSDLAQRQVAAEVVKPQTITVQAAAPTVNVAASPAPNVTVQAAPAPNVTVQAAPPAKIDVHVPPLDLSKIQPPIIPPVKTDWYAEFSRIGAGLIGLCIYLLKLRSDSKAGKLTNDLQDACAFGLQWAKGDGPARLTNALEIVRQRWRLVNGGADMSAEQQVAAEHGLAALHAASAGLVTHDADEELKQEEANLKQKLSQIQARLAPMATAIVLCVLVLCSGCHQDDAAREAVSELQASTAGSKVAFANLVNLFVNQYVASESARADEVDAKDKASHDAPYAAKIAALQRTVKLADGTTLQTGDPIAMSAILDQKAKLIANLEKQHQRNLAQVQRTGEDIRAKLLANATDIDHIIALSQGLTAYYAQKTNLDASINANAAQVLSLAQQFMPPPKAPSVAPTKKKATNSLSFSLHAPVSK